MNAFLTGSQVYGKPTKESDVDLVVTVDFGTYKKLHSLAGVEDGETIRFGKLNLILCLDDLEAAVWKVGTEELKDTLERDRQPTNKVEAKKVFDRLRAVTGLTDKSQSG